jgi:hypothetical protein
MKKKITIIGAILLVLVVAAVWAVPAFAADPAGSTTQSNPQVNRVRILARLLLIQDETKVDAIIAGAQNTGKITPERALKIKEFWTNRHQQFFRKVVVTRLLWAKDGTKVQAFLDKGVAAGKITEDQSAKLMALWTSLHTK